MHSARLQGSSTWTTPRLARMGPEAALRSQPPSSLRGLLGARSAGRPLSPHGRKTSGDISPSLPIAAAKSGRSGGRLPRSRVPMTPRTSQTRRRAHGCGRLWRASRAPMAPRRKRRMPSPPLGCARYLRSWKTAAYGRCAIGRSSSSGLPPFIGASLWRSTSRIYGGRRAEPCSGSAVRRRISMAREGRGDRRAAA